jgi:MFS family permease
MPKPLFDLDEWPSILAVGPRIPEMVRTAEIRTDAPRGRRLGPNYAKLWCASAISNVGDGVRLTALPLLAATLTREPSLVAGVSLAGSLPWLLFALLAGAIADRHDRRVLMWRVQVFRMVVMGALSAAILMQIEGLALIWVLYGAAFLLGMGETLFDTGAQSIMPSVVDKSLLKRANGRLYAVEMTANEFVGPPVGSFLFVAAAAAPFIFDAATFGIAALLIYLMTGWYRAGHSEPRPQRRIHSEIAEGLRWLWGQRLLRTLGIMTGIFNLVGFVTWSTFVLFALEELDLSERGFGVLIAAGSLGAVLGALAAERLAHRLGDGPALHAVTLSGCIAFAATGLTSSVVVVAVAGIATGFGSMMWNVIAVSLRQSVIPTELLGRVNSVYRLLAWGTMPLGAAVGGVVADGFGLRAPYFLGAATLAAMLLYTLPLVNNRTIAAVRATAS